MKFVYHSIDQDAIGLEEELECQLQEGARHTHPRAHQFVVLVIVAMLVSCVAGFLAGWLSAVPWRAATIQQKVNEGWTKPIVELNNIPFIIKSNTTYTQDSPEADDLWDKLYPADHHGLFRWPDETPRLAGFAGFHQLHCVDSLRRRFYQDEATRNALINGQDISGISQEITAKHFRHCIEVLRNGVLCHADNTLQVEAEDVAGIPAFGTTAQCRDWWQMVDWVNNRNRMVPNAAQI